MDSTRRTAFITGALFIITFITGIPGLILGYLMYRSGLVPRGMAILGLIGGTVLLIGGTAALFDVIDKDSALKALAALPEAAWELALAIYLLVKGFKPSPILSRNAGTVGAGTT